MVLSKKKKKLSFSSTTLVGEYQIILVNIQSAVFALQWYMAEVCNQAIFPYQCFDFLIQGKFPLDDLNAVFEFFERYDIPLYQELC
jgi:hypothetical protein